MEPSVLDKDQETRQGLSVVCLYELQNLVTDLCISVRKMTEERVAIERRLRKLERRVGPAITKVFQ